MQGEYAFTVPKYDTNGNELVYTVEEVPVDGFVTAYNGFDIKNTYLPPVVFDTPIVHKLVKGDNVPDTKFEFMLKGEINAPMPNGSDGNSKIISVNGSGETDFGAITFTEAGTYIYTITELYGGAEGWSYDTASYILSVTVTETDGILNTSHTLTKDGQSVSEVEFTNSYNKTTAPDKVIISGQKIWNHGDNPEENRPDSIIVEIYGDNALIMQYQVTEHDNWSYTFELPRYAADGHEIVYTISESDVPHYTVTVDGYNLINTYLPDTPDNSDTPGYPDTPDNSNTQNPSDTPDNSETGDSNKMIVFTVLLTVSGALLVFLSLPHIQRNRKNIERKNR